MFNFFWRMLGYEIKSNEVQDENKDLREKIEDKYSNFEEYFARTEELKNIEASKPNENKNKKITNFEKFYLDYEDEILNKDELQLIHNGMDMDNIIFNIGKNYQESKYDEFMKIVDEVKNEKKRNGNLLLTNLYTLFDENNYFEKKYVYTYKYDKFEIFYENWKETEFEENKLKIDELEVVFENLRNLSYTTIENETKFNEIKRILDKILRRKAGNGNKRLYKMMYLGTTYPDEYENEEAKNIYKFFFE